ncbi:hypothetical protein Lal_00028401, partial [Lupinus albus]
MHLGIIDNKSIAKVLGGLSDKAMAMILDLLRDAFVEVKLSSFVYELIKIINKLGLNYTKIDSCLIDCMLFFWDEKKTWVHVSIV